MKARILVKEVPPERKARARFQLHPVVALKVIVVWDVTPYSPVYGFEYSERKYYLFLKINVKTMRRIFVSKRYAVIEDLWKLHSEDLHKFNLESNIIITVK
jgi:hypothetical protein